MSALPRITLLFDGGCGFCRRSLAVLRRFDPYGRIETIDANDSAAVRARFPSLPDLDLDRAMFAIDARGRIFRGFDAFRAALWSCPLLAPLAWTWYVPGVRSIGSRLYDWIARHRRDFGCGPSCPI